ncbi:LacI family DNA-binding transcriptional regulator [Sporomusa termitida]|nr:LacI family DNA-binding transcriptional regulator [Sporomusa termitida]
MLPFTYIFLRGDFIPTLHEVAALAGVSRMTVSRYINGSGYVSEQIRLKIQEAINQLQYRPNRIARSLTTGTTKNIALILSDISNPLYTLIIKGVETLAFEHGYNLIVCNTGYSLEREQEYVYTLVDKLVDGIIIAPSCLGTEHLKEVKSKNIPLVFVARKAEGIAADCVTFDDFYGSYQLIKHLTELGHRRIGVICRQVDLNNQRLDGYQKAVAEAHIPYEESLLQTSTVVDELVGYDCARNLLEQPQPPTAIFTTVNKFAGGTLLYCRHKHVEIPRQLALVSFDSFAEVDYLIVPQLTCNIIPAFDLGHKAAELLFLRINDCSPGSSFSEISLKGEMLVRASTVAAGS